MRSNRFRSRGLALVLAVGMGLAAQSRPALGDVSAEVYGPQVQPRQGFLTSFGRFGGGRVPFQVPKGPVYHPFPTPISHPPIPHPIPHPIPLPIPHPIPHPPLPIPHPIPHPPLPIPHPIPHPPLPIPHPIPHPPLPIPHPIPHPPLPIPHPIPHPPLPIPHPIPHPIHWPPVGCWPKHWPIWLPPVYIQPPPVVVLPAPGDAMPENVQYRLTCYPVSDNLQDLNGLDVTVQPVASGEVSLSGTVGFTDQQNPQAGISAQAEGDFLSTEINLSVDNVGTIYLMPQQDDQGGTYFQGDLDLYGRKDSGNLVCVVNQLQ